MTSWGHQPLLFIWRPEGDSASAPTPSRKGKRRALSPCFCLPPRDGGGGSHSPKAGCEGEPDPVSGRPYRPLGAVCCVRPDHARAAGEALSACRKQHAGPCLACHRPEVAPRARGASRLRLPLGNSFRPNEFHRVSGKGDEGRAVRPRGEATVWLGSDQGADTVTRIPILCPLPALQLPSQVLHGRLAGHLQTLQIHSSGCGSPRAPRNHWQLFSDIHFFAGE